MKYSLGYQNLLRFRFELASVEEVLDDFPDLTLADIQACFAFAADRDRRLTVVPYEVAV